MTNTNNIRPIKFSHLGLCNSFKSRMTKEHNYIIIMGDDEKFWIVTKREASILMRAGYELAPSC